MARLLEFSFTVFVIPPRCSAGVAYAISSATGYPHHSHGTHQQAQNSLWTDFWTLVTGPMGTLGSFHQRPRSWRKLGRGMFPGFLNLDTPCCYLDFLIPRAFFKKWICETIASQKSQTENERVSYDALLYSQILQILKRNHVMFFFDQDFSLTFNHSALPIFILPLFYSWVRALFCPFFQWSGVSADGIEVRNWVCGPALPFGLFSWLSPRLSNSVFTLGKSVEGGEEGCLC